MYKVKKNGVIIHDPSLEKFENIIMDGVVGKRVNHADSFQFTIYPNNVGYADLHLITSRITVLKDDAVIFHGRPLTEETGWENEKRITCEGDLALLNDSVLRPYTFSGSVAEYVRYLINTHNSQVGADKQITVRHITVTDPNGTIRRSNSDYVSVMQEIMDKTVGSNLGGYLHTEYDATNDVIYLDYLVDSTNGTNQTLEIGKNILDFQRSISSEALATALIPLGATDQDTGERLTIKSVNEGQDYIVDSTAAAENGLIYATYTWDDVTQPANLLSKARAVLTDLTRIVPRIQLSAVDLTNAGVQVDAIGFFEYVTVVDSAHNVSGQYLITERVYNISAPENDTVTFGGEEQTISGQSARTRSEVAGLGDAIINKAIDIIDYQTDMLKGGAGGYMVIGTDEDGHPNEAFFMDTDSIDTARSILRLNKNGIGFSTTGIGGPYTNAWTIDGNLNASFITTGIIRDRQNKNYWNLNTGEFVIREGSISISTDDEKNDIIRMSHNEFTHEIQPLQWIIENTAIHAKMLAQAGGIYGYRGPANGNTLTQAILLTSDGRIYLGGTGDGGGYAGRVYIRNDSGTDVISLSGASGNISASGNITSGGAVYAGSSSGAGSYTGNNTSGTRTVFLNAADGGFNFTNGTAVLSYTAGAVLSMKSNANTEVFSVTNAGVVTASGNLTIDNGTNNLTYTPGSYDGMLALRRGSNHTFLLWPDSNGAGRLILGDGTSTKWRTELTNSGLVFRNASDAVTAQYHGNRAEKLVQASPSAVTTTSSYDTLLGSVTLGVGLWMITAVCAWANNGTGRRTFRGQEQGASASGWSEYATGGASSGGFTTQNFTVVKNYSSQTVYELYGEQTSGNDLNATMRVQAVQIA